jgi:hypothetical protein
MVGVHFGTTITGCGEATPYWGHGVGVIVFRSGFLLVKHDQERQRAQSDRGQPEPVQPYH